MNKQARIRILAVCGLAVWLAVATAMAAGTGELTGVVQHYDPSQQTLDIAGKRYRLTAEAEAELLKATPGIRGFVGQAISYSATQRADGVFWIEVLSLVE